jgi:hypothetical protein
MFRFDLATEDEKQNKGKYNLSLRSETNDNNWEIFYEPFLSGVTLCQC